jgi:cysteine desulfurase
MPIWIGVEPHGLARKRQGVKNLPMNDIYLDHNATTTTRPEVVEAIARAMADRHANPASQHQPGQRARRVLEDARERIAEILGAHLSGVKADRLIFTSGGTEANNLAILGIAHACQPGPSRIIISAVEHSSGIQPAERLLEEGWQLDSLGVDGEGVVRIEQFRGLLAPPTRLASVLWANHDTGVIQPIAELARLAREAGIPLHTDAVQAIGKLPVHFGSLGVASMSIAAHKFQGPLGIGGLLLRHGVAVDPLLFGGSQQEGLRPGTESVPLAVGMLTALELWQREQEAHRRRLAALSARFENGLKAGYPGLVVNSARAPRLPNTSNIAFPGLEGQVLLVALDLAGVACSVGSACSSGSTELSPTLLAMGLPKSIVGCSLRFSLGATTTEAEIDEALGRILHVCHELRG